MADVEDSANSGLWTVDWMVDRTLNNGLHNGLKFSNQELVFDVMKYLSSVGCRICYHGWHTIIVLTDIMYYINLQLLQSLVLSHCIPTLPRYLRTVVHVYWSTGTHLVLRNAQGAH